MKFKNSQTICLIINNVIIQIKFNVIFLNSNHLQAESLNAKVAKKGSLLVEMCVNDLTLVRRVALVHSMHTVCLLNLSSTPASVTLVTQVCLFN